MGMMEPAHIHRIGSLHIALTLRLLIQKMTIRAAQQHDNINQNSLVGRGCDVLWLYGDLEVSCGMMSRYLS